MAAERIPTGRRTATRSRSAWQRRRRRIRRRALDGTRPHRGGRGARSGRRRSRPTAQRSRTGWTAASTRFARTAPQSRKSRATIPSGGSDRPNVAWQPIPPPRRRRGTCAREGATPCVASLVPAYRPCESPNREHGPPLAFGACGPPEQTSTTATVGTPDANGRPAPLGRVRAASKPSSAIRALRQDEADVAISVRISDVRRQARRTTTTRFALDRAALDTAHRWWPRRRADDDARGRTDGGPVLLEHAPGARAMRGHRGSGRWVATAAPTPQLTRSWAPARCRRAIGRSGGLDQVQRLRRRAGRLREDHGRQRAVRRAGSFRSVERNRRALAPSLESPLGVLIEGRR